MQARARIRQLLLATAAALVLVALTPWLNPCIGPLRFVDCVEMESSTVPNALAPWLFCPFGVCDFFPSALDRAVRILVVVFVLAAVGVLTARTVSTRKAQLGAAAAIMSAVIAGVLNALIYVGPAA